VEVIEESFLTNIGNVGPSISSLSPDIACPVLQVEDDEIILSAIELKKLFYLSLMLKLNSLIVYHCHSFSA